MYVCNNLFILRIIYIETSAANGQNVDHAVKKLLDMVMKRMKEYVSSMDANEDNTSPNKPCGSGTGSDTTKLSSTNKEQQSSCPC